LLEVFALVLPLFSLIFIGFFAGKIFKLPLEGLAWMNVFIIYVALPAMFYQLLAKTPVEQFGNLFFIAITTFTTLLVFCLVFVVAGYLNKGNVGEATIQGFAGAYGNIGYMGPPLAIAAFGPLAGVPVALVFCFDNTMHFILAPLLMGVGSERKQSLPKLLLGILQKIFTHPFIIATILGISGAIFSVQLPQPMEKLLTILANAAAPCALFTMGLTASLRPLKKIPVELTYIMPVKLLLHPLLVYLMLTILMPDLDRIWLNSAVLMAALPTATNVFVIAQQYNVWQERASSAVILSTFIAMFTLTILLYFIT